MSSVVIESGTTVNLTASAQVGRVNTPVTLLGFYVNSTTAGTIAFANSNGGTAIGGTITPAIGFHRFPASCPTGLYVTIVATLDVTLFYISGQA